MPLSGTSSQDTLQPLTPPGDHHHTGRYVVVGAVLAVTLLILHHVLLRDTSTIAGICIPTIVMMTYILWVFYSARKDRLKTRRMALTMQQLTEVISNVPGNMSKATGDSRRCTTEAMRETQERNPAMTSVQGRPVMLSTTKACQTNETQQRFNHDLGNIT
ncbi:uncharacterized protein [Chelonus insularis]|uniref:uncharacterized protein n=1 Tax=Chelonus insularis TaxID=460826 RepID=UPI00158F131D|nr:uncharacterized protein LOC118074489 [Chelonus insularis]XP_034951616.1 uncharacterized protein LOC118074489 [Chelonus insularis]XP_034951617.1 uncharacterized protein LOC118074489 [Chelonus insularis]